MYELASSDEVHLNKKEGKDKGTNPRPLWSLYVCATMCHLCLLKKM